MIEKSRVFIQKLASGTPRQIQAFKAIEKLNLLNEFEDFMPFLVGSIPLDIDNDEGDLDFIFYAKRLREFTEKVESRFKTYSNFQIEQRLIAGEKTVIARFEFEGFLFELFCQSTPIVEQRAFGHLLAEMKLLKMGGHRAKEEIQKLKKNGVKTEPAFAQYFSIEGDAYFGLLRFAKKKPSEIQKLLFPVRKIISGGQTGVDRAALDFAIEIGMPHGGWCPSGRIAEDGPIDVKYELQETESDEYNDRTIKNIESADGTLVFTWGGPIGGTLFTIEKAFNSDKPYLAIDFREKSNPKEVLLWLQKNQIETLNIAGPRASQIAQAYETSKKFISRFCLFAPIDDKEMI